MALAQTRWRLKMLVDYAMPLMKMEALLREIHDLCLDKKYGEASQHINSLEFEAALLRKNLHQMELTK